MCRISPLSGGGTGLSLSGSGALRRRLPLRPRPGSSRMPSREAALLPHSSPTLLLGLLALTLGACTGDGIGDLPATTGTLEITTSTDGDEIDPDGYTVQVDGEVPQPIGPAGRIQRTAVEPTDHTLRLDGLAL